MALKDRLERLERLADEHITTFVCPECGEEFRDVGDLALKVVVADWQEGVGEEVREPDPVLDRIMEHPHDALVDEVLRSLPGLNVRRGA